MIKIHLPEDILDYLQRLNYEVQGTRSLCSFAFRTNLPHDQRIQLLSEYQETYVEYELAKGEMYRIYGSNYPNSHWHVDFIEEVLCIEHE